MNACRRLVLLLVLAVAARAELPQIEAEPNAEKRSKLALDNAAQALKLARDAYDAGDLEKTRGLLNEVKESVELADTSLKRSGKKASRSPKYFKIAELKTSELLRRLESFDQDMNFGDRPILEPVKTTVQQVHDGILDAIMGKGK
jgi:hypothetical protein